MNIEFAIGVLLGACLIYIVIHTIDLRKRSAHSRWLGIKDSIDVWQANAKADWTRWRQKHQSEIAELRKRAERAEARLEEIERKIE